MTEQVQTVGEKCIKEMYQNFRRETQRQKHKGINDYCLLNSVLKRGDEVRLHSRFLHSMLNPNGMHYCGSAFLGVFLKIAGIQYGPKALDDAKVSKEDGFIDILISIGEKHIILENKLYAGDQKRQITRYIKTVMYKNKLTDSKKDYSDNIAVIYLSHQRKSPTGKSIQGLKQENKHLKINSGNNDFNGVIDKPQVEIHPQSSFQFVRMDYLNNMRSWVLECKKWLLENRPNNNDLMFAFNDYSKVIDRLDRTNRWKNVFGFSDFILGHPENIQQALFEYMVKSVNNDETEEIFNEKRQFIEREIKEFMIDKILMLVKHHFPEEKYEDISDSDEKNTLTRDSLRNWILEKGKKEIWKNVGLTYKHKQSNKKGSITFGQQYCYVRCETQHTKQQFRFEGKYRVAFGLHGTKTSKFKKNNDNFFIFLKAFNEKIEEALKRKK